MAVALGAFAVAGAGNAQASLVVTFDPAALASVGSAGTGSLANFNSDTQNGGDNSLAVIQSNGNFTENGILAFSSFALASNNLSPLTTGLLIDYNLYLTFTATGSLTNWNPANPANASGQFNTLTYQLIATPTSALVTPPTSGTAPSIAGTAPVLTASSTLLLASSSLVINSSVSTNNFGIPTASVLLGLTQAGTTFFAAPPGINEFDASFTNSPGTFTYSGVYGDGHENLAITGSFNDNFAIVPEPASIALIGSGLLGLGFVGRRRRNA
jgi:hypothetical protein